MSKASDAAVVRDLAKEIYTLIRVSGPRHVTMPALCFAVGALLLDEGPNLTENRSFFMNELDEAIGVLRNMVAAERGKP